MDCSTTLTPNSSIQSPVLKKCAHLKDGDSGSGYELCFVHVQVPVIHFSEGVSNGFETGTDPASVSQLIACQAAAEDYSLGLKVADIRS